MVLQQEVRGAIGTLETGKSSGTYNFPAELFLDMWRTRNKEIQDCLPADGLQNGGQKFGHSP